LWTIGKPKGKTRQKCLKQLLVGNVLESTLE
jgi:hypothetical protein